MAENIIGNYCILSELGQGACGHVYLAQHTVLQSRNVALKLMHKVPLHEQEDKTLFLQESRLLEVLRHPYILPIIDAGIHDGSPYIVTEYAPNGSLRQLLRQQVQQPLPQLQSLTMLAQIGSALHFAHQQQVVHRDLKPENILFNVQGDPLLADFGLAVTLSSMSMHTTTQAGTPAYMAPEQVQGVISRETDQYALGCIAYELFTGQRVFTAPNIAAMMFHHLHTEPIPPSQYNSAIPPYIESAILKALAKERHNRHSDIATFLLALGAPTVIGSVSAHLAALSEAHTKTLSQSATSIPTIASDGESRFSATVSAFIPPMNKVANARGDESYSIQPTQRLPMGTDSDSFRLKQRRVLVALVSLAALAIIMIPSLFQLQSASTKGTLALVPIGSTKTPATSAKKRGADSPGPVPTPKITAIVLTQPNGTSVVIVSTSTTSTHTSGTTPVTHPTTTPVANPTPVPTSQPGVTPTPAPTATPIPTDTPIPTATPIPTPTVTPVQPTPTDTPTPVQTPIDEPTATPTPSPSATPTSSPTPTPSS